MKDSMCIKNMETYEVFDATNILPEYFYTSVPLFNNGLEKEIDGWLHVMKYDEVPPNYHSLYMRQVANKLSIIEMTKEERANYSYYQKKLYNDRDEWQAAKARGEGRGEAREKIVIARNLLKAGLSIDMIAESTGLSREEI